MWPDAWSCTLLQAKVPALAEFYVGRASHKDLGFIRPHVLVIKQGALWESLDICPISSNRCPGHDASRFSVASCNFKAVATSPPT